MNNTNNSRSHFQQSSPQTQHIEYFEEPIRARPISPLVRCIDFTENQASKQSQSSAKPFLALKPTNCHSISASSPPDQIIHLGGFMCRPGHREYEAAARAKGVKDGSGIYWFRETRWACNNRGRDVVRDEDEYLNETRGFSRPEQRQSELHVAKKRDCGADLADKDSVGAKSKWKEKAETQVVIREASEHG